ncbi:MAG TPA: hypothetical protein VF600_01025 [Abditibacteriaceae bacterium]
MSSPEVLFLKVFFLEMLGSNVLETAVSDLNVSGYSSDGLSRHSYDTVFSLGLSKVPAFTI